MTRLGLELSDAGILAAGGNPPKLLAVDGRYQESPGYAVPAKKRLLVGKSAADKAHLFPLQVIHTFWDQLNADPLEKKYPFAQNHAEIACAHLSHIWKYIKIYGDELIIAVPDFYGREQMGLILGMAQELSIPVKGFVSLPIAASFKPFAHAMLLYLDIHLHRFEIIDLRQGDHLTLKNSVAVREISLEQLYRNWVESIAEEFVRTTRFDPLHQAATEQELYNRLPTALEILKTNSDFIFEISQPKHRYRITLFRDMLKKKSAAVYDEICRFVERFQHEHGITSVLTVLQLTHRIAGLPGLKERLSKIDNCHVIELEPGAGALGVLRIWDQLSDTHADHGASFFAGRSWQPAEPKASQNLFRKSSESLQPTHLLYHDIAYALSETPLLIGSTDYPLGRGIHVQAASSVISKKHCTVQRDNDQVLLIDYSNHGTFVDNQRVVERTYLNLGQTIRLGTSEETIRLIACKNTDES